MFTSFVFFAIDVFMYDIYLLYLSFIFVLRAQNTALYLLSMNKLLF